MRISLTLLFFISLLCSVTFAYAQEEAPVEDTPAEETTVIEDSLAIANKYGIRLGVDLSKLVRTALDDNYSGVEIQGDFRVSKRFYAAAELGTEERKWDEENLQATATGSYAKVGVDFNMYRNWVGLDNAIFAGLRYGFSSFEQELTSYSIFITDQTFPSEQRNEPVTFDGLTASWVELIIGVKTEILNNLFLSINVQLKTLVSEDKPDNFDNLIIPGYNRTYDFSDFGAGWGYTISYLIPIIKK